MIWALIILAISGSIILIALIAIIVVNFIYDPLVRFICQYAVFEKSLQKSKVFWAYPIPYTYGKWQVVAMWLWVLPVRLESVQKPWPYYNRESAYKGIQSLRADPTLICALRV